MKLKRFTFKQFLIKQKQRKHQFRGDKFIASLCLEIIFYRDCNKPSNVLQLCCAE